MDERIADLFGIAAGQRMTYEEALEYFQSKLALSPREFFRLRARYRALAFTVSGYASATVIKQFQDTLTKAIEDGTTLEQFRADMNDWLKERGYRGVTPYQAENVFRTNLQTAYNVGAYRQMRSPAVLRDRPYWMYDAVEDSHTRKSHLAMNGRVFPADSPVWDTWYPPNGFRCRCSVISLTEAQVRRMGLKVETEVPQRVDIGSGFISVRPDRGFGYNAATVAYEPDLDGFPESIKTAYERRDREGREKSPV